MVHLVKCGLGREVREPPTRKWPGVKVLMLFGSSDSLVNGREFKHSSGE